MVNRSSDVTPVSREGKLAQDRIKGTTEIGALPSSVDIMQLPWCYASQRALRWRIETFFIAPVVAIGDMDGKPPSAAKIMLICECPVLLSYCKPDQLQSWA